MPHAADKSDRPGFGPAYHWRDGWTFQRCVDEKFGEIGEVLIANADVSGLTGEPVQMLIPAAEWASIVAHVSAFEPRLAALAYDLARFYHGGTLINWIVGEGLQLAQQAKSEAEAAG